MRRKAIFTSIVTALALSVAYAEEGVPAPRLVVGLTIDQFSLEQMETFSSYYGDRGFKRLMKEGRLYRHAEYDFAHVTTSSAVASIYTGTVPYLHGIVGDAWIDRTSLQMAGCVDDPDYMGYASSESTSAHRMQVSCVADELMVATSGHSLVYSIAPMREAAVLAAGHAASGAFWLNDETGKWAGSTYYGLFPRWVSLYNERQGLDMRIKSFVWGPYLPITAYSTTVSEQQGIPFRYKFDDERKNKYRKFKTSPYVNDEVNRLAEQCLNETAMGRDNIPDLLCLEYYAGTYGHLPANQVQMEVQDSYIRLDKSLANLFDMIDRKVGLQQTLFVVTSTGNTEAGPADAEKYRIPTGEFSIKRCAALLNLYLGALYGDGIYVDATDAQEIYLSHKLIEQKQLHLTEVLNQSAEFLMQFSGVRDVYSSHRLLLGTWTPELNLFRNHYNRTCSGDLWIEVLPGWNVVNERNLSTQTVRSLYASVPLFFMGWRTVARQIDAPVSIGSIAPTMAQCMRIRAPNAAGETPLYIRQH